MPGRPDLEGARNSLDALEFAVGLTRSGAAAALVTGPVSKAQLYAIGFVHPGQTEFVAERCGVAGDLVAMMLAGPTLRVDPGHHPHPAARGARAAHDRADRHQGPRRDPRAAAPVRHRRSRASPSPASIPMPARTATLGREEIDIIVPAIERLREEGYDVSGPHPPDIMFHERRRRNYDAALCMYHDQALIPLKTLHFDEGINVTLGLPIVRTSPDHGTAFDIAGKGIADPGAMIAAIRTAGECARRLAEA